MYVYPRETPLIFPSKVRSPIYINEEKIWQDVFRDLMILIYNEGQQKKDENMKNQSIDWML